jgi:hypothetical protein
MSCDEFEIQIDQRRYGALDPSQQPALDAHLAACETCREYDALARGTDELLHASPTAGSVKYSDVRKRGARFVATYRRNLLLSGLLLLVVPVQWGFMFGYAWLLRHAFSAAVSTLFMTALWASAVWFHARPFNEVLRTAQTHDDLFVGYRKEVERQLVLIRRRSWSNVLLWPFLWLGTITGQLGPKPSSPPARHDSRQVCVCHVAR